MGRAPRQQPRPQGRSLQHITGGGLRGGACQVRRPGQGGAGLIQVCQILRDQHGQPLHLPADLRQRRLDHRAKAIAAGQEVAIGCGIVKTADRLVQTIMQVARFHHQNATD